MSRDGEIAGLVSTIIPVHNRPALLRDAVGSVLAQSYRPIEIIIVDDGSTDDTPEAAEALAAAHPDIIRTIHTPNSGPGSAREAGRQLVRGEFVQYLDSDDLLWPEKFDHQVGGLREYPKCGIAYGWTRFYELGTQPIDKPWKRTGENIAQMFPSFLLSRWWDTSTPLYRRAVSDLAGPWSALRSEEDWEYDCRVASHGVALCYCPCFVSDTRTHSGAMLSAHGHSPPKLRDRAQAHRLILRHAQAAGIGSDVPEMKHFARELFLLARQCGAAGLANEARWLYELAREASGPARANGLDFALYGAAASVLGWTLAGRLACRLDELRR